MKIELTIDRIKKLPDGAIPALEAELLRRLSKDFFRLHADHQTRQQ
jgi:hypothetical protein